MTYPAPTLFFYKAKQKWYVTVTIPEKLRPSFNRIQMRRSTGTADKRIAGQKMHDIAAAIYRDFDRASASQVDQLSEETLDMMQAIVSKVLPDTDVRQEMKSEKGKRDVLNIVDSAISELTTNLFSIPNPAFANLVPIAEKLFLNENYAFEMDKMKAVDDQHLTEIHSPNVISENYISIYYNHYLENRHWDRDRTKSAAKRAITEFVTAVGDMPITDVTKQHAYEYAQKMHVSGKAFKTIKSKISAVSALLTWSEKAGDIKENPFVQLKLAGYGVKSKKYRPFSEKELHAIFAQKMEKQDRLLITLLLTTGMRLDEVALLDWSQYHVTDGIRYFDLTSALVKNEGSKRLVPIPDIVKLKKGNGRLFDYNLDSDGKASTSASKHVMKIVRNVVTDKEKVIHSFRGTLKDLMRDVDVKKDISDFITGHSMGDVASSY
ncbi:DUF6538 domain-containing protein, partial [Neptunicoccus sediminis]|uniref:DUF6538 domain-containing protein n=1 Tax=Neptunicoccus sediminis TaxID=1892596 RepID=UPI0012FF864E